MNPKKDTKTRRERPAREPSDRRAAQLDRMRREPPALTTVPNKRVVRSRDGLTYNTVVSNSHHIRRWSGQ